MRPTAKANKIGTSRIALILAKPAELMDLSGARPNFSMLESD
jgi:hypothetical protein